MKRYVTALMTKICAMETPQIESRPAISGPTTREPFSWVELSEMAPGRSRRSTSIGTVAWNAGAPSALPVPIAVLHQKSAANEALRLTRDARANDPSSCTACMVMRYGRRRNLEASSPPGIDSRRTGPSWPNTISPTRPPDLVRCWMYAGRATFCIHVPIPEANMPIHTSR